MLSNVNFSLTQIEYVLAVHRYGHFAKAAESCHVTQPTLSMQIQKLEDDLGVVLFDRTKKPILLSEAGKKLIEQMQSIVYEAKKIDPIIKSIKSGGVRGDLTVGVIPTVAPYLLPLLLPVIKKKYPDLILKVFEMQTHRIIDSLQNDEIDVGILALPIKQSKIFEKSLYCEPFSILSHRQHELTRWKKVKYSHLKFSDIWLLEEGHCLRHQVIDICSIKKKKVEVPQFQFESGSLETIKNIVDRVGGYTLLPELASHHFGKNSQLIPFERPIPAREVGLVFQREHYKKDLIDSLGASILESIPAELRNLKLKDLEVVGIESL